MVVNFISKIGNFILRCIEETTSPNLFRDNLPNKMLYGEGALTTMYLTTSIKESGSQLQVTLDFNLLTQEPYQDSIKRLELVSWYLEFHEHVLKHHISWASLIYQDLLNVASYHDDIKDDEIIFMGYNFHVDIQKANSWCRIGLLSFKGKNSSRILFSTWTSQSSSINPLWYCVEISHYSLMPMCLMKLTLGIAALT